MKNSFLLRGVAALSLVALSCGAQAAASFGSNLIVNGNAEAGTSGWTGFDQTDLFQSVAYGNNWVKLTEPGPVDRGAKLFAGQSSAYSAGFQLLDVSGLSASFAGGQAAFNLTGYLGGWTNQGDNAQLYVSFLDAGNQEIGAALLGPVTPADRGNQTGLLFRASSGLVPVNTTQIQFSLSMERLNSSDNDGYADNLSFVLSAAPVPEPASYALLALGLGAVGLLARRRKAS